jgi:hypothetical protein
MAELDLATLLPTILVIVVSFVMVGVTKLSKTSDNTIKGTIQIEHMQLGLSGLESRINDQFEKLEDLINRKDRDNRDSFQKVWERLEKIESETKLHSFRLDMIDKHQLENNNDGGK